MQTVENKLIKLAPPGLEGICGELLLNGSIPEDPQGSGAGGRQGIATTRALPILLCMDAKSLLVRVYRLFAGACLVTHAVNAEVNQAQELAPGVWFHEGDIGRKGHCNNGWVVFEDHVLVIDANFPSGAQKVLPKIRAQTDRPIRFVFDTHHHGDHAYGNQFWHEQGAAVLAHEGVLAEMKRFETGYFTTTPGRWEDTAKQRPDVAQSRLRPPALLFAKEMILEDRRHRVELRHFGVAHTRGDGFAWLPTERILFTGDACVNGPYNFMGDGHTGDWVTTLEAARALNPKLVCPGHGLMGGPEVLDHQIAYIQTLRAEVKKLVAAKKTQVEVKAAVENIKATLQKQEPIAIYVGSSLSSQVEKVYVEMGGKPFESAQRFVPASDNEVVWLKPKPTFRSQ